MKFTVLAAVAAMCVAVSANAEDKACCKTTKTAQQTNAQCVTFANLNVNADQKSKLERWEADCMKAGCTKESHDKFMRQAKTILNKDQYAQLKKECDMMKPAARS
jgi:hypothetical protein